MNSNLIVNVNDLNGTNGFTLQGINEEDYSGTAVSSAGDVNGDGIDDIIIGAPGAGVTPRDLLSPSGIPAIPNNFDDNLGAGESYVVFGGQNFTDAINLAELDGSNGFVVKGADAGDTSGTAVSSAGDVNGDGIDDIIIGAPNADPDGELSAGASYLIFGNSDLGTSGTVELAELDGVNGVTIEGVDGGTIVRVGIVSTDVRAGDRAGYSVSRAGDVNGDGIDDIVIAANLAEVGEQELVGKSYVVFGDTEIDNGTIELAELDGDRGFAIDGLNEFDRFGSSVSAGDINSDGIDDLIIGASDSLEDGGKSYVLFGGTDVGTSGNVEVSQLDGTNGFVISSNDSVNSPISRFVSNAGDINSDGFEDIVVVSAFGEDDNDEAYVLFGGTDVRVSGNVEVSQLDGTNGFVISNTNESDFFIRSVSSAEDIDGDGIDDLVLGAPSYSDEPGKSYVLFGSPDLGASGNIQLDDFNGLTIDGKSDVSDRFGSSVSAGDINGDGLADIIIGARFADPNEIENAGESYTIFGGEEFNENMIQETDENDTIPAPIPALAIFVGGDDSDTLRGNEVNDSIEGNGGFDKLFGEGGDDTLEGGLGADTLNGGADNDLLIGNSGFDLLFGNKGNDVLVGGSGNDTLFGGNGADSFVLTEQGTDFIGDYFDGVDNFILGEGLEFNNLEIIQNIDNTQIKSTATGEILATLNTVTANFIQEDDFVVES